MITKKSNNIKMLKLKSIFKTNSALLFPNPITTLIQNFRPYPMPKCIGGRSFKKIGFKHF
jgi:hypothetical protein